MLGYIKISREDDDKKRKNYHCSHCGTFITDSGALTAINGATEHSYVNPAGIRCNFKTFVYCENVVIHEDLFIEHSWFPGYGWRFLICKSCLLHLGWKYDAVSESRPSDGFFGVLIDSVQPVGEDEEE